MKKDKLKKAVSNKMQIEQNKQFVLGEPVKQRNYEYYIDGIKMPLEAFLRQLMITAGRFICVEELFKFRSDRVIKGTKFERREIWELKVNWNLS